MFDSWMLLRTAILTKIPWKVNMYHHGASKPCISSPNDEHLLLLHTAIW